MRRTRPCVIPGAAALIGLVLLGAAAVYLLVKFLLWLCNQCGEWFGRQLFGRGKDRKEIAGGVHPGWATVRPRWLPAGIRRGE